MPINDRIFEVGLNDIIGRYHQAAPEATIATVRRFWRRMVDQNTWLDDALYTAATDWMIQHISRRDEAGPAIFLEAARRLFKERERRDDTRRIFAADRMLPAPPPATGTAEERRSRFASLVATGRARIRRRFALIEAARRERGLPLNAAVPSDTWHTLDEPTADEIARLTQDTRSDPRTAWRSIAVPPWPGEKA